MQLDIWLAIHTEFDLRGATHFPTLEHPRVVDEGVHPLDRVSAPEKLATHDERRYPKHASVGGLFRIGNQLLLDRGVGDERIGIGHVQCVAQATPVAFRIAALIVDEVEGLLHMRTGCAKGHQKAQSGQRVERMAWGHTEGDSVSRRGPRAVSIGMDALARELRRALCAPAPQQTGKQHGNELEFEGRVQLLELSQVQVTEWRQHIEEPVCSKSVCHLGSDRPQYTIKHLLRPRCDRGQLRYVCRKPL